jgi:hypothetical protein
MRDADPLSAEQRRQFNIAVDELLLSQYQINTNHSRNPSFPAHGAYLEQLDQAWNSRLGVDQTALKIALAYFAGLETGQGELSPKFMKLGATLWAMIAMLQSAGDLSNVQGIEYEHVFRGCGAGRLFAQADKEGEAIGRDATAEVHSQAPPNVKIGSAHARNMRPIEDPAEREWLLMGLQEAFEQPAQRASPPPKHVLARMHLSLDGAHEQLFFLASDGVFTYGRNGWEVYPMPEDLMSYWKQLG